MSAERDIPEQNMQAYIPVYVAGLLAGMVGLIALISALGADLFTLLAFLILPLGFCVSWCVNTGQLSKDQGLVIASIIALGLIGLMIVLSPYVFHPRFIRSSDPRIAEFLAFLMIVCSYNLTSSRSVLFLCVPTLSMIGLLATLGGGDATLACFIVFIGLASFILMQTTVLSSRENRGDVAKPIDPQVARSRLQLTFTITIVSLSCGLILGVILLSAFGKMFLPRFVFYHISAPYPQFSPQIYQEVATGPASDIDQEVLNVQSSEAKLWRGQTFDKYNGKGWLSEVSSIRRPAVGRSNFFGKGGSSDWWRRNERMNPPGRPSQSGLPGSQIPTQRRETTNIANDLLAGKRLSVRKLSQNFSIVSSRFQMIFAAAEPRSITANSSFSYAYKDGMIQTNHSYGRETSYRVVSEVSSATPRQLRAASPEYPEGITSRYLQTPESCWEVSTLTRQVTEKEKNNYDKAVAIRNYLVATYKYDLNSPPTPSEEDPVPYFLFKSRIGYCDIFSSAMVIMCRQAGIPARWVTGFAPGGYGKDNKYHVSVKDKHAWVEVYFKDYGWIEFDPTPGGEAGTRKIGFFESLQRLARNLAPKWPTLLVAGSILLLLLYLLKVEILDKLRISRRKAGVLISQRTGPAIETYARMCKMLSRFGFPKETYLTPSEYAAALSTRFDVGLSNLSEAVVTITTDFEEARYADSEPPQERLTQSAAALSRLLQDLRSAKKQRLLS